MLVLTRKENEEIHLHIPGHEVVKIVMVQINPTKVRVGIEADKSISVVRPDAHVQVPRREQNS